MIVRVLALLFLFCISTNAQDEQQPEPPFSEPPKLEHSFTDDFEIDSRGDYEISGKTEKVTWEKGRLELGDGAIVQRKLDAGFRVEMELELEFPKLTKDGQVSDLKVWLDLEGATDSFVWFRQKRVDATTRGAIFIVNTQGDWNQKNRMKLVSRLLVNNGALPNGVWRIGYRHGLWSVRGPENKLNLYGHIDRAPVNIQKVILENSHANTMIRGAKAKIGNRVTFKPSPEIASRIQEARSLEDELVRIYRAGRAREAVEIGKTVQEIRRQNLGRFHPDYPTSLINLAALYKSMGQYDKAEKLCLEAKTIYQKVLGKEHPDYTTSLNNLAAMYQLSGRYNQALPLYLEAKKIKGQVLGNKNPDYASSLGNLAILYASMGDYEKAESICLEVKAIYEEVLGKKHPGYANSLNNLAEVYNSSGDYKRAEPLYLEAKEITRTELGDQHPSYAMSLNNLARLYQMTGDYERAEPLYIEAKTIQKEILGEDHPAYANSLNNLAALYGSMGDFEQAEPLYLESKEITRKTVGKENRSYAMSLSNLAWMYHSKGEYAKAKPLYLEAKAIRERVLGKTHPDYSMSLNNLAGFHESMGDYHLAKPLFLEAKAIHEKVVGKRHQNYVAILENLAGLTRSMGDYEQAELLHNEASTLIKDVLGGKHPNYARSLSNQAKFRYLTDNMPLAYQDAKLSLSIRLENLDRFSMIQSEVRQRESLDKDRATFNLLLSITDKLPAEHQDTFGLVVMRKGSVLSRQKNYRQLAKDANTTDLFSELRSVASQLAKLTGGDPSRKNWKERNEFLQNEFENLEKQIAQQSARFRPLSKKFEIKEFIQSLPSDSSLVNFTQFKKWIPRPKKNPELVYVNHLAAFVVSAGKRTGDQQVKMIDLGPLAPIDQAIVQWRKPIEMANQNRNQLDAVGLQKMKTAGDDLRRLLWEPIERELPRTEKHVVIVSTDGPLGRFPLIALPGREKEYLVEERKVVSLPVPRLIPEMLKQSPVILDENSRTLLVGGIDYGKLQPTQKAAGLAFNNRSLLGTLQFGTLKGTENEVGLIRKRFPRSTLLTTDQATEKNFKTLANEQQILHIATHGFFKSPTRRSLPGIRQRSRIGNLDQQRTVSRNPNLLSGLAFANANNATNIEYDQAEDDGILYSAELAMLTLEKVELAVMSACDTGLGQDSTPGEGLIGIQRAFQVAGVKSTIASFWKVDDTATMLLMNKFYENLLEYSTKVDPQKLKNNQTTIRIDALRDAQLWMLNHPIIASTTSRGEPIEVDPGKIKKAEKSLKPADKNKRTHPRYWAAFQLSGDWR